MAQAFPVGGMCDSPFKPSASFAEWVSKVKLRPGNRCRRAVFPAGMLDESNYREEGRVDPSWIDLVTKVGFPIVVALLVGRWAAQRVETAETRSLDREKGLNGRVEGLEHEIRGELKMLARESTQAVMASNQVTRECTLALRECTSVLSKLKQSAPAIQLPMGATEVHIDATGSGILEKGRGKEKGMA